MLLLSNCVSCLFAENTHTPILMYTPHTHARTYAKAHKPNYIFLLIKGFSLVNCCCVNTTLSFFRDNQGQIPTFTTGKVTFGLWTQWLSKCGYNAHINTTHVKYITASFKNKQ